MEADKALETITGFELSKTNNFSDFLSIIIINFKAVFLTFSYRSAHEGRSRASSGNKRALGALYIHISRYYIIVFRARFLNQNY